MSSRFKKSLIHLRGHNQTQITDLFLEAKRISLVSSDEQKKILPEKTAGKTAALVFFEASTRTRLSFETACARLGIHPLILDGKSGTSLEKGETYDDTILNIAAMNPSVMIVRSGDGFAMEAVSQLISMPLLNAGWGKQGHPSQALLDAYTIWNRRQQNLEGEKVLIIGDVRHSRVASSHFELSAIMNYEVALCGPAEFLPENPSRKVFAHLEEGLRWATVVMALRVQNERHSENHSLKTYSSQFGLNRDSEKWIHPKALIMHPGPINHGVEMDIEIIRDRRSVILEQVTHGVYIRQALVHRAVSEGVI